MLRPQHHRVRSAGIGLLSFALSMLPCAQAWAEAPRVLDRAEVARLAAAQSPAVRVAERRIGEARALRVGAGMPATVNPELSAFVGPRWENSMRSTDFFVGLAVPLEISGAPSQRKRVAVERAHLAESEARASRRSAVAEALDLWARARSAEERARLEAERLTLDRALVRAAEVRRRAGTSGDGDLALARVLEAQGAARKVVAEHERDALIERLRSRLGLSQSEPVVLGGSLTAEDLPPLATLLEHLPGQPSVQRAARAVAVAQTDASLQRRIGVPVPRFTAGGGRDPETYLHLGLDLPIPIFQRNQTNVAVAAARVETARAEYDTTKSLLVADLRAAYLEYRGTREALRTLDAAMPFVADAEHLATRGYELGQTTLTDVATARREAAAARLAYVEAELSLARARIAVDVLAGAVP